MNKDTPITTIPIIEVNDKLFNRGIKAVLKAQFFSAFAVNVLFFAFMEIIHQGNFGKEATYILQGTYVLFYIILAPPCWPYRR